MTKLNGFIDVKSSTIKAIGYDKERNILGVQFISGGIYSFEDVEPEIFEEFKIAESKGKFFAAKIKGKYDYEVWVDKHV